MLSPPTTPVRMRRMGTGMDRGMGTGMCTGTGAGEQEEKEEEAAFSLTGPYSLYVRRVQFVCAPAIVPIFATFIL